MTTKKTFYILLIALTVAFSLVPLANLSVFAFKSVTTLEWSLAMQRATVNTLLMASLATIFSLVLGTVLAYVTLRTDVKFKSTLRTLLLSPYIIPSYLLAIGWIILANPSVGILNKIVPIFNVYGLGGIVFVETLFLYTFVYLNVANALTNMDGSLEESARLCGASPIKIFFVITLPLLKSTLIGSGLLVFLWAISSFGVPAMVGAPAKVFVLTTHIYQLIKIGTPQALSSAAALALPIVFIAFILLFVAEKILAGTAYKTLTGKHTRKLDLRLRQWRLPVTIALVLFAGMVIGLPLATIFIFSLMPVYGDWHLSFKNYAHVLFDPTGLTLTALQNSLLLALISAAIIAFVAFLLSYFVSKTRFAGRNMVSALASLPYATPGTILGMALLFQFTTFSPLAVIVIAYCTKYLSFGMKVITPALNAVDSSLEEAGLTCGASWLKVMRRIWFPVMRGALTTTVFLSFAPLFSELTMSILLVGPTTPTLGARLFQLQEYESPNQAAVLAVIILVLVLAMNMAVKRLSKGRLGI